MLLNIDHPSFYRAGKRQSEQCLVVNEDHPLSVWEAMGGQFRKELRDQVFSAYSGGECCVLSITATAAVVDLTL